MVHRSAMIEVPAQMSDAEKEAALAELDRLINDPEVTMDSARVWALAGRLSAPGAPAGRA